MTNSALFPVEEGKKKEKGVWVGDGVVWMVVVWMVVVDCGWLVRIRGGEFCVPVERKKEEG